MHNQTAKIPQHYLSSNNTNTNMKNPAAIMMAPNNMTAALSAVGVPPHSSMSMNNNNDKLNLSTSQKKRISLKKLEEEYCKTIEQIGSPNSSTLNLENMKKT